MKDSSRREFLKLSGAWSLLGLGVASSISGLAYGYDFGKQMKKLKKSMGTIKDDAKFQKKQFKKDAGVAADRGKKGVKYVKGTFQDITPEQEYYIGRAVGADILKSYKPWGNRRAGAYINVLGQSLAQASDRPETFGGYHFMILDSGTINAFAAPGGLIFVTRGMLRCCPTEDAAAAVLAHEVGHIQHKHGLQAIKKSRITNVLTIAAVIGASMVAGQQVGELTANFGASINDITGTINKGYSRAFEREADRSAVTILKRVGYDPSGIVAMLEQMQKRLKPGGLDFVKTHPKPAGRIADIRKVIGSARPEPAPAAREARFKKALGKV